MAGFHLAVYERLPEFLKRRIHPLEYAIRDFVEKASRCDAEVVLDAGAGEGRFRHLFGGRRYFAVDSAAGDPDWDYSGLDVVGDLGALPFGSAAFDLVLNTQVLEHVEDPAAVVRELWRVLRPGGRLFLTAPQGWHEHQQPLDFYRFTRFSLGRILGAAGFSAIEIEPMGGFFHYLGHRLTYVPKVLFEPRRGPSRLLLFPIELLVLGSCCLLGPLACYYLDRLDRKREFTLCYRVRAEKPSGPTTRDPRRGP
jgi:SAM-dependent methyltransferase